MNNINSVNFNTSSNFQSNMGFKSGVNASSMASENRFSFGGLDIEKLASGLIEAAKTGQLPEGLLEALVSLLSPVELGQLLGEIAKLLNGETNGNNAPGEGTQGNAPGETGHGNAPTPQSANTSPTDGETTGSNRGVGETGSNNRATATPSAPTSDTRITTRAADSANLPKVEAIANDPVVAAAIEKAWNASNPNTPGSKQEQGFWVMRDDKTGALSTVNFPSSGSRDSLTPGAVPAIEGKTAVAFFHTHPNTVAEGYTNGPSTADQKFADRIGIPGIIQSHNGMYYFDPAK